jgi:hypothetical protein
MKKAYLIDFIGFTIAKAKNISHLFSMTYMASGNRCAGGRAAGDGRGLGERRARGWGGARAQWGWGGNLLATPDGGVHRPWQWLPVVRSSGSAAPL